MNDTRYDVVPAIMAFEEGEASQAEILALFSHLVKDGSAWRLQGMYGRIASGLISDGYLAQTGEITDLGREAVAEEDT